MSAVRRWTWPIRTPGSSGRGARSWGSIEPCGCVVGAVMAKPPGSGSGDGDDDHGGARRVAGQEADLAVLDRHAERLQAPPHRGELGPTGDLERPVAQPDGIGGGRGGGPPPPPG